MGKNLSLNGVNASDANVQPFVGTQAEFVRQVKANVDIGYELLKTGQCQGGKFPDGTTYSLCPGGVFTQKAEDGKVEMHAIKTSPEGFKDYYIVKNKDFKTAGCVDQDGKKCE